MRWLVVAVVALSALAGCLGSDETSGQQAPAPGGNIWEQGLAESYETPPHVVTGNAEQRRANLAPPGDPGFLQFDQTMQNFIDAYEIPAAQLGLMHDGQLIYTAGYGYTKMDGTGPTDAAHMFRMASVSKPIANALIHLPVEQGLMDWDDRVFCIHATECLLPIQPHPSMPVVDGRIGNITLEHLVGHTGGWGSSMNHLYRPSGTEDMRAVLGFEGAPAAWQAAQYMMGTHLEHDPGAQFSYCNVCYMLAGLVAEAATGATYDALLEAYFLRPLDLRGDLALSETLPEDRNPREPFYNDDDMTPSVHDPNETVRQVDGGINFDVVFSAGGLAGTTEAVATIYGAYPDAVPPRSTTLVDGNDPWENSHDRRAHGGLLDGTSALSMWADDKTDATGTIQFVVLFNDAGPSSPDCVTYSADVPTGGSVSAGFCPIQVLLEDLMALTVAKATERSAS